MNYKLYALLLTLTLAATPALQAMRATRTLLATARSLRQNTPALTMPKNGHEQHKNYYEAQDNYHVPVVLGAGIAATAIGQALAQEDGKDEETQEQKIVSIDNLSLSDFPGILEALQHASEEDKRLVAQAVARCIWHYKVSAIIKMLQCTKGRPHRILIHGIAKNITWYSPDDISQILKSDGHEETHALIASALKNNYQQFTSYTVCGLSLYSNQDWRKQYASILKTLKPAYHGIMLQPILDTIEQHNIIYLIYVAGPAHKKDIITAFTNAQNIDLSVYDDGRELMYLLEITKPYGQSNLAHAIAKNINKYNGWHFFGFVRECTEESKEIIAQAITQNIEKNIHTYDATTRDLIKKLCNTEQKEVITSATIAMQSKMSSPFSYNQFTRKWEQVHKHKD